jgi:hypothetical protein
LLISGDGMFFHQQINYYLLFIENVLAKKIIIFFLVHLLISGDGMFLQQQNQLLAFLFIENALGKNYNILVLI